MSFVIFSSHHNDGDADVKLYSKDGVIWMNQQQMRELYQTAKSTLSEHIQNILQEGELVENSVVRNFRTTASDGKLQRNLLCTSYN